MSITLHGIRYKWEKDAVVDFILSCREQGGIPIFKTRFANVSLGVDGKPAVLAVCWGGMGPELSRVFTDVPSEIREEMEKRASDWLWLLERYAPQKAAIARYKPVVIPSAWMGAR
ncbi:MAG: hypothetical protein JRD89_04785 [Deltaproteobacteria bacterium]|nr:hypothetical protein [Deltaproteobacteria bacterium]